MAHPYHSFTIPSPTLQQFAYDITATPSETASDHVSITTALTTAFVKRADGDSSSSGGSSRTRDNSSSSNEDSCAGDKQQCQKGSDLNGTTVGLAVAIPVAVFLLIIGYFMWRSYKKGKKEAETDDDPDFYGETTILPDYPTARDDQAYFQGHDKSFADNQSYYSMNPFGNDANSRYPTQAINAPPSARIASEKSSYYGNYPLPQRHDFGSKQSLDEFAKHTFGNEYSGYSISRPSSRATSRNDVRNKEDSIYGNHSLSSTVNLQQQQQQRLAAERALSNEESATPESSYSQEIKFNNDEHNQPRRVPLKADGISVEKDVDSEDENDVFKDPEHSRPPSQYLNHQRQVSDFSYVENEPEVLLSENTAFDKFNGQSKNTSNVEAVGNAETLEIMNQETTTSPAAVEDEDDEDIKRMKSVYRVYFDRESSVKGKKPEHTEEDAPPLPSLNTVLPSEQDELKQRELNTSERVLPMNNTLDDDESNHEQIRQSQPDQFPSTSLHPDSAEDGEPKSRRAVSSIYSSIPLSQFEESDQYQQHPPQQYPPQQYPPQQYPPQQYPPQQYPPHPQQYQQYPQQQQRTFPVSASRIQMPQPRYNDPKAPRVPNANKMNYDSVVTNTEYAPTKSFTSGSRPSDLTIKPFNPLHYSDQIFQPTSPSTPNGTSFENLPGEFQPPGSSFNDQVPSPHHIRQSIVMVNPVEIGKQKIFRPAGSFTQYQQNSANSSRNGSMTSQSVAHSQYEQQLPRNGSQADLRKQLGASDNYSFV